MHCSLYRLKLPGEDASPELFDPVFLGRVSQRLGWVVKKPGSLMLPSPWFAF
jgi:hypothetical protein